MSYAVAADEEDMILLRPAALLAAAALAPASAASAALSPSAYRAGANAVCARAQTQLRALPNASSQDPTAVAKFLPPAVTIWTHEYAALRALQPPPSLVGANRRALWARWELLSISVDAVKQLNNGANPEVTAQTWIGKAVSIGLALHEAAAWKVAGVTTCERTA